jgi:hypothetical protein
MQYKEDAGDDAGEHVHFSLEKGGDVMPGGCLTALRFA